MSTESGETEEGYPVPVQLHPHTEALVALLVPDAREGPVHDCSRESCEQGRSATSERQRYGEYTQDGISGPSSIWVSPPSILSLREQAKQLQQQKRAKQRQHVTLDPNPRRFEVPLQDEGCQEASAYQLVGASTSHVSTGPTALRRERGGGVLVPLRMMASLVITDGSAVNITAGGVTKATDQRPALSELRGREGMQEQQQDLETVQRAGTPSEALGGSLSEITTESVRHGSEAVMVSQSPTPERRTPLVSSGLRASLSLQRQSYSAPVPEGSASPSVRLSVEPGFVEFQAQRQLEPHPHDIVDSHQQHTSLTPLPPQQEQHQRQEQATPLQEQQVASLENSNAGGGGPSVTAGGSAPAEDDGDGEMLIDVGSADRAAEGALLPTPGQARAADTGSGWDALRGLGLAERGSGAGLTATGSEVAVTLALLSPGPPAVLSGAPDAMQVTEQDARSQPEAGSVPGTAGPASSAGPSQGKAMQQPRGSGAAAASLLAGPATGGAAGLGGGDEGFDADDEGETARREERARTAFRSARSSKFRPLPGLTVTPPWEYIPFVGPHADRHGLSSLSGLAAALESVQRPSQSHLITALNVGTAHASGSGTGGDPSTDTALAELLKLKVSLRRAMQSSNIQAMGLILSLLAALPATPGLLADSQAAALVSPLQQHENPQVAAAARHLVAVWKGVLKAAVRQAAAAFPQGPPTAVSQARHLYPHGAQSMSGTTGLPDRCQDGLREWDVPMRDQAQTQLPQRPSSGAHAPASHRHQRLLNLARSQSDELADSLAAMTGAVAAGHLIKLRSPPENRQLASAAQTSPSRAGLSAALALQIPGWGGRTRVPVRGTSPSGSRTVTEGEAGGHTSAEETNEEGAAGPNAGSAIDAAEAGRFGLENLGLGSGGGSGGGAHTRSTFPAAVASGGGGGILSSAADPALSLHVAVKGSANAALPLLRQLATSGPHPSFRDHPPAAVATPRAACPLPLPSPGMAMVPTPDATGTSGKDRCGGFGAVGLSSWRPPALANPGCVLAMPHLAAPPDGLPGGPLRSPALAAVAPLTPAALLLVPPAHGQPASRKRKAERERPSSRRRVSNPNKRAAAASGNGGPFAAPRPLHATLSLGLGADPAGSPSEEQRSSIPGPHGPVTGLKTPARPSLLGLHSPLSKRPRHHAGGAAGPHGGGPHHTATQVRRMSLLLSSLDLGGASAAGGGSQGEGGPEDRSENALLALEGDADADADMGSHEDGMAMLTSEEDEKFAVGNGGSSGGGLGLRHLDLRAGGRGDGSSGRREAGQAQGAPTERRGHEGPAVATTTAAADGCGDAGGAAMAGGVRGNTDSGGGVSGPGPGRSKVDSPAVTAPAPSTGSPAAGTLSTEGTFPLTVSGGLAAEPHSKSSGLGLPAGGQARGNVSDVGAALTGKVGTDSHAGGGDEAELFGDSASKALARPSEVRLPQPGMDAAALVPVFGSEASTGTAAAAEAERAVLRMAY